MHTTTYKLLLRSMALGSTIAACLALVGCAIANFKQDPISALMSLPKLFDDVKEIKTVSDIKRSFVFRAAELLFPDGITALPEKLPVLTAEQQELVNQFLAKRIDGIQDLAAEIVRTHAQYAPLQTAAARFKRVKFLVTGKPEAIVDDAGVVFIDVRIVQAILRSVIIHWERNGGMASSANVFQLLVGPDRGDFGADAGRLPPEEEARAIAQFNLFKASISKAAPNTEIGIWYKMLTESAKDRGMQEAFGDSLLNRMADRAFSAMEAQMREAAMLIAARYAQETFESSVDFLVAHELAHQTFGHAAARAMAGGDSGNEACSKWQSQELLADEFAAVLLIQRQLSESRAPTITETKNGYEQKGDGFAPTVDGRSLFLSTAFKIAGFSNSLVKDPCLYPTTRQRITRIDSIFEFADSTRNAGLYLEGLLRGHWGRSRDNARLTTIFPDTGQARALSNDGMRLEPNRIELLVRPLVENRFRDHI